MIDFAIDFCYIHSLHIEKKSYKIGRKFIFYDRFYVPLYLNLEKIDCKFEFCDQNFINICMGHLIAKSVRKWNFANEISLQKSTFVWDTRSENRSQIYILQTDLVTDLFLIHSFPTFNKSVAKSIVKSQNQLQKSRFETDFFT